MGRALTGVFAAAVTGALMVSAGSAAAPEKVVQFRLMGFGTPLSTSVDVGRCPGGRTMIKITSASGSRIGTALLCVISIKKTEVANYGVRRIVQTVLETDSLAGGTLVSRQRQIFLFARDQRRSVASFRGRVVGGTGRYSHASGSVNGGGPGIDGKANWAVRIRLR